MQNQQIDSKLMQMMETQKVVLDKAFDRAEKYVNLIIMSGYAGFFGLWQITKSHLDEWQVLSSALLISISLTIFVLFEVFNMLFSSLDLLERAKFITNPENKKSPSELTKTLKKHQEKSHKRLILYRKIWLVCWLSSVVTGIFAIGILMWGFIKGLFVL
jgi:hypothetical protein